MKGEVWNLFDAAGRKTGRTMIRGEEVPEGLYHIAVHIWPVNKRGELLIQRRAETVQWKPGMWAVTGGSAIAEEDPLTAARRELREELGYAAAPEEMLKVACLRRSNSFLSVYMVQVNWKEEDFVLQKEEVSAVKWCSKRRLLHMVGEGTFYNYGDAYYRMLMEYQRNRLHASPEDAAADGLC